MGNKIKILFSDLDGTLLDDNKHISSENMDAIQKMLKLGHHFVVTTGRPLSSAIKKADDLGLMKKGSYIINFQGGSIYDCGSHKEIYKKTLDLDKVDYIFQRAKEWGIHVQTYREDTVLSLEETKELQFYSNFVSMPYEVVNNIRESLIVEPGKVLLVDLENHGKLRDFQQELFSWEVENCNSVFSNEWFLEYCPKGATKGEAITFLSKYLGIPKENTIGAGDAENDISMWKSVGTSVCMKNGHDEIKKFASFVTENDNNHHGIREVIEKFVLN